MELVIPPWEALCQDKKLDILMAYVSNMIQSQLEKIGSTLITVIVNFMCHISWAT